MNNNLNDVKELQTKTVCLYDAQAIAKAIEKIARQMNAELADKNPILLCAMNGALIFLGQLAPLLNFPLQIDYIHTSRFRGEMRGGDLHWLATPTIPLKNRNIIIIEDILDSGITLAAIKDYCVQQGAKEVLSAVLVDKAHPREEGGLDKAEFTGLNVPDKFLIGFGLDYKGYLRNIPGIYAVEDD
ncbi:MAG: hypoxanthine-guanine phosphoribosyltransferase [Gammaproteobacteria bacterium]|jgi:hypoxanthine phosphoribosyltransferase